MIILNYVYNFDRGTGFEKVINKFASGILEFCRRFVTFLISFAPPVF